MTQGIERLAAERSRALLAVNRAAEARTLLVSTLGAAPSSAELLILLAEAHSKLDDDPAAIEVARRAWEIAPEWSTPPAMLARLAMRTDLEYACNCALALRPEDAAIRRKLALVEAQHGRLGSAVSGLANSGRLDPSETAVRHGLLRLGRGTVWQVLALFVGAWFVWGLIGTRFVDAARVGWLATLAVGLVGQVLVHRGLEPASRAALYRVLRADRQTRLVLALMVPVVALSLFEVVMGWPGALNVVNPHNFFQCYLGMGLALPSLLRLVRGLREVALGLTRNKVVR